MLGSRLYLTFFDQEEWDKKINNLIKELNSLGIHPSNKSPASHHRTLPPIPPLPTRGSSISLTNIDLTESTSTPVPLSPVLSSISSSLSSSSSVKRITTLKVSPSSADLKEDPETWKVQDVCAWLKLEGMDAMVDAFTKEVVDGNALKELSNMIVESKNDARLMLKDMGVNTGDFLRFCKATAALFQQ